MHHVPQRLFKRRFIVLYKSKENIHWKRKKEGKKNQCLTFRKTYHRPCKAKHSAKVADSELEHISTCTHTHTTQNSIHQAVHVSQQYYKNWFWMCSNMENQRLWERSERCTQHDLQRSVIRTTGDFMALHLSHRCARGCILNTHRRAHFQWWSRCIRHLPPAIRIPSESPNTKKVT